MKVNTRNSIFTHEGAPATDITPYERLKRTVMACMLFEDNFYEDGMKAADRITQLCSECKCLDVLLLAFEAANKYHLRHIPLQMIVEALKLKDKSSHIAKMIYEIITRPDMMCDLLALYWKDGKKPIPHQLKRGLARAFTKFDEYQLSKWNKDNPIKLRDVLFMVHAKPLNQEQAILWTRLVNNELKTADTWETRLSAGEDKNESFKELLENHRMGKLAILRNLRNMANAGIEKSLVASELMRNLKEMLPFQYLAAAKECPQWEDIIDPAMVVSCALKPKLKGQTIVLIDVSGSMDSAISSKSKMMRLDAACGMAILLRECIDEIAIFTFSQSLVMVPPRHGMALRDAIINSQAHGGTYLGNSIQVILNQKYPFDRIIVITDEQSYDAIPTMPKRKNYILNVAAYQNGIGNKNQWMTITGFSEASIDYIREIENVDNR